MRLASPHTLFLIVISLLSGCTTMIDNIADENLETTTGNAASELTVTSDDPLLEQIVHTVDGQMLTADELYQRMSAADVVYLGEVHDNRRHHELELSILRELAARGLRPAIGFEFFSQPQTSYLISYTLGKSQHGATSEAAEQRLRSNLGWGKNRDQEWQHYFPLIQLAKQHELTVFGADLPVSLRRRITQVGVQGLSGVEKALLRSTGFSDDVYRQFMEATLTEAHCGWSEPELLNKLYQTWLERNDAMAAAITSMVQTNQAGPVVMILGGGHVHHNKAVYERVAHLKPELRQLNLGFQELATNPQPAATYFDRITVADTEFAPLHEYLWFTPKAEREDPCQRFKEQLKRHQKSAS